MKFNKTFIILITIIPSSLIFCDKEQASGSRSIYESFKELNNGKTKKIIKVGVEDKGTKVTVYEGKTKTDKSIVCSVKRSKHKATSKKIKQEIKCEVDGKSVAKPEEYISLLEKAYQYQETLKKDDEPSKKNVESPSDLKRLGSLIINE